MISKSPSLPLPLLSSLSPFLSRIFSLSFVSFFFSLSLSSLFCLSVCLPVYLPVCLPGCLPAWLSACLCLSLSVSVCLCLSLSVSVCLCLSLSVSVCLCLSLSVSVCLCLSVSVSVCLCLSLSVCLSLSLSFFSLLFLLSSFPCISLSLSLPLLSLSPSLACARQLPKYCWLLYILLWLTPTGRTAIKAIRNVPLPCRRPGSAAWRAKARKTMIAIPQEKTASAPFWPKFLVYQARTFSAATPGLAARPPPTGLACSSTPWHGKSKFTVGCKAWQETLAHPSSSCTMTFSAGVYLSLSLCFADPGPQSTGCIQNLRNNGSSGTASWPATAVCPGSIHAPPYASGGAFIGLPS